MFVDSQFFGTFYNQPVHKIRLENNHGMTVDLLELGGIITSLKVPDTAGVVADVVLGFDDLASYVRDKHYFGALIGRVANRIEGAHYRLNGEIMHLDANAHDGRHCVHGGRFGYHRRVWQLCQTERTNHHVAVSLALKDLDGEEGFNHNVDVTVRFELNNHNCLSLSYCATADGPTPISLTSHSYFNLEGHQTGNLLNHHLTLYSEHMLPQREDRLPSGDVVPVGDGDFAFTHKRPLSPLIAEAMEINHSYVIHPRKSRMTKQLCKMARLEAPNRSLEVWSNELTLHFYNGHNLDGLIGKQGAFYDRFAGLCLEPKGYVNGINDPAFPCCIIDSDKSYKHRIEYRFNV